MTCENCLYNRLCISEDNIPCEEFMDTHYFVKLDYLPGDTAYTIAGGNVQAVTVESAHCTVFEGNSFTKTYYYKVKLGGESVERHWRDWGTRKGELQHKLYHTLTEALEALCKEDFQ